ncbi:hypothetical protein TNIN_489051 [Trichonephila inaurata madagascariensis]|uniref:Uncharacterized protein n=1 Tax=Trichonephila inaurata madagascariensis TaxID=2747483 RepID=A0A8X6Y995_9ARAC|nr:hypothetical protein TNIN_489051 [Trichonephila inaurata madagascariensis]
MYRNTGALSSPLPFSQSNSAKSNYAKDGPSSSSSLFGSSPPTSSSRMNRPVPPATSQAINHDFNGYSLSTFALQQTTKFMPRRGSPYVILRQRSLTTFEVANLEDPDVPIGV